MKFICKKCGETIDTTESISSASKEMDVKQLCFHCNYWADIIAGDSNEYINTFVVANGRHYVIGDENNNDYFRGFGGSKFTIKFFDGRIVKTSNLWYQGEIPERFRDELPDNATIDNGWK